MLWKTQTKISSEYQSNAQLPHQDVNLRATELSLAAAYVQDLKLHQEEGKSKDILSYPVRLHFKTTKGRGCSSEDLHGMFKGLGSGVQSQELQRK